MLRVKGRRPSLLGAFDEETCRFFLQQLGESVVPYFPFYYGIEQVYEVLLAIHGEQHVADAMSVLHELLEDDSVAIGKGDEGDAWRSWRYDWRHRNVSPTEVELLVTHLRSQDNPLDPASPRVGTFLLPPPTPKRVRLIKSANFLALHANSCITRLVPKDTGQLDDLGPSVTPQLLPPALSNGFGLDSQAYQLLEEIAKSKAETHGARARTGHCISVNDIGKEQDQQFLEVDVDESESDPNDPLLVSFVMMQPPKSGHPSEVAVSNVKPDVRSFRQVATSKRIQGGLNEGEVSCICNDCRISHASLHSSTINEFDAVSQQNPEKEDRALVGYPSKVERHKVLPDLGMNSQPSSSLDACSTSQPLNAGCLTAQGHSPVVVDSQQHDVDENCKDQGTFHGILKVGMLEVEQRLSGPHDGTWTLGQAGTGVEFAKKQRDTEKQETIMDRSSKVQKAVVSDLLIGSDRCNAGVPHESQRPLQAAPRRMSNQGLDCLPLPQYRNKKIFTKQIKSPSAPLNSAKQTTLPQLWTEKAVSLLAWGKHRAISSQVELGSNVETTRCLSKFHTWGCSDQRSISPAKAMAAQPRPILATFDGTCDEPESSPAKSIIDLNKQLPPSPLELQESSDRLSRSTASPFSCDSLVHNSIESPAASNISSLSSQSTKTRFRSLTHEIMYANDALNRRNLSPVHERHSGTSPVELGVAEKANDHRLDHISYSSIRAANPYQDGVKVGKLANVNIANDKATADLNGSKDQFQPRHVPHALSENNIQYLSSQDHMEADDYYLSPYASESARAGPVNVHEEPVSEGRGRNVVRAHSPSKPLSDVAEELGEVLQQPKSSRKRSCSPHKKMFGNNGWLNRSQSSRSVSKAPGEVSHLESPKKAGLKQWGDKVRRRIGDYTTLETGRPLTDRSTFAISLNPPFQSRLYGELELMICVSGNKFLMDQYERGRMSADSVAKINASWRSKNRAQVREFQYDQLTQRDLVLANVKTFVFYGDASQNSIALNGILSSWKHLAKEMSVRTFCTADSQIKKHLLDSRRVLELLGTPLITFLAFQELQSATYEAIRQYQTRKTARVQSEGQPTSPSNTRLDPIGDISFGGGTEPSE